jgi:hypothetical protein
MLMRLLIPTRGDYESVLRQDDDLEKMAYIKEGKRRNKTSGQGENW